MQPLNRLTIVSPSWRWLAALGVLVCVWADQARAQSADVHFQVTHADGTIRHEPRVPKTAKDIRHVLRVTRYETAAVGAVILSTGAVPRRDVQPGRTVTHALRWNGSAWVASLPKVPPPPASPPGNTKPKPPQPADDLAEEVRRTRAVLATMERRLAELDRQAGQAQRKLDDAKGKPPEPAAKQALADVRTAQQGAAEAVARYRRLLGALEGAGAKAPGKETGTVAAMAEPPKSISGGIVAPVGRGRVAGHRLQVWPLPADRGERAYEFWMAHPEAGSLGAFYYVAFADTDGDGKPDRQIARSPLAQAARPGQWTRWKLRTDQKRVFVGQAWRHPQTQVYAGPLRPVGELGKNWHAVGSDVWVAPHWGAPLGRGRRGWGFTTNLRYRVDLGDRRDDPADLSPSAPTGSGIYEWNLR